MDVPKEYQSFISEVKNRIHSAQYEALKAVNKELVGLYWEIGRMIFEKQKELGWGDSVIQKLAKDLENEFPNQRGFSDRNLRQMVMYYNEYQGSGFWQSLTAKIGFTHNMIVISKCQDSQERKFYINSILKFGWTTRVLSHQIDNKTYEKYLLNQTKDRLVVEYALKKSGLPIGIASYSTSPQLPEYYEKALPSLEQFERGLAFLTDKEND